jgi:hypothetical protein
VCAAPETINSRLAMLGVTSALAAEFVSGIGIKEQVATAPLSIAAVFILISLASYIPIVRYGVDHTATLVVVLRS